MSNVQEINLNQAALDFMKHRPVVELEVPVLPIGPVLESIGRSVIVTFGDGRVEQEQQPDGQGEEGVEVAYLNDTQRGIEFSSVVVQDADLLARMNNLSSLENDGGVLVAERLQYGGKEFAQKSFIVVTNNLKRYVLVEESTGTFKVFPLSEDGDLTEAYAFLGARVSVPEISVTGSARVRATTDAKGALVATLSAGTTLRMVSDEYIVADGFTWHEVEFEEDGVTKHGFVAETNNISLPENFVTMITFGANVFESVPISAEEKAIYDAKFALLPADIQEKNGLFFDFELNAFEWEEDGKTYRYYENLIEEGVGDIVEERSVLILDNGTQIIIDESTSRNHETGFSEKWTDEEKKKFFTKEFPFVLGQKMVVVTFPAAEVLGGRGNVSGISDMRTDSNYYAYRVDNGVESISGDGVVHIIVAAKPSDMSSEYWNLIASQDDTLAFLVGMLKIQDKVASGDVVDNSKLVAMYEGLLNEMGDFEVTNNLLVATKR